MHISRFNVLFLFFLTALLSLMLWSTTLKAQVWETSANHPGNNRYVQPDYPLVFVAAKIIENPCGSGICGSYNIGTDVLSINDPDPNNHLWILKPNGQVEKLFPLPIHQSLGLIDTPQGQLFKGSAHEPSVSEDGTKIYFSYFQDATFANGGFQYKGSDLYVIDLSNPAQSASQHPVKRLTTRTYNASGHQVLEERIEHAMNPAQASNQGHGTVYISPMEMRTFDGLKLVYTSNEKRLDNSNNRVSHINRNFNLHIADILDDGSLANSKQFQYYTTTSALSPTPLREGLAFSYQATTEDPRNWQVQGISSTGKWYPVLGYGINPEAIHLGSLCIKTRGENPGDYFVGARYYNLNNEGFGSLWAQDLSKVGINAYDDHTQWAIRPRQVGSYKITDGVNSNDFPSAMFQGEYIGKMTTPRCGRPDELYMAYTPTSANGRLPDPQGNRGIYHSYIAYRPNLEEFFPLEAVNLTTGEGLRIVVDDSSDEYSLVWPVPLLSWSERTGDPFQSYSDTHVDEQTTIAPGLPFSQVGTSALYNTDIKAPDCWLGGNGQNPFHANQGHTNGNQEHDFIHANHDNLTKVIDQNDFCAYVRPQDVLGMSVQITSNKTGSIAYETDNNSLGESSRQLGVYDVRGQSDQSFQAIIPANTPFEFHLIDREYGMRLTDVRSWHSLKPRETRNDCGGCHNHEEGAGISFEGTYADQNPPLDLVNFTSYLTYDADCEPLLRADTTPTKELPEWRSDIWPKFDQNCGGCHNNNLSNNNAARNALGYNNELDAFTKIIDRRYAKSRNGALGSAVFWAARGERTDGRNNDLPLYQPNYAAGDWGYHYGSVHNNLPGLCDGSSAENAEWVYRLGLWIDNHAPRDLNNSGPFRYNHDWYHPAVDGALFGVDCSNPDYFNVGYWDDSGLIDRLQIEIDGNSLPDLTDIQNGNFEIPISQISLSNPEVLIKVIASDPSGNRQMYEKSIKELTDECLAAAGNLGSGAVPPDPPDPPDPPTDPDPPINPHSARLMVDKENAALGERLTFIISSETDSDANYNLICSGSGTEPGHNHGGTRLNLNYDQVVERTNGSIFSGQLENGADRFELILPIDGLIEQNSTLNCQTILRENQGTDIFVSNVTATEIVEGNLEAQGRRLRKKNEN